MPNTVAQFPQTGLSALERQGALMPRFIHEVTNFLVVIAGNAHLAEQAANKPEIQAQSLQAIRQACTAADELIERCAAYQRSLDIDAPVTPTIAVRQAIVAANPAATSWPVVVEGSLKACIRAEPRWLAFSVWQMVRESRAAAGQIKLAERPPAAFAHIRSFSGCHDLFQVEVLWHSGKPLLPETELQKPKRMPIAVVFGLLHWLDGQPFYRFTPPDSHSCLFLIPSVAGNASPPAKVSS
jgi:hypothetical protein